MNNNIDSEPMLYFGYGSNLDKEDWTRWCNERGINPDGLKEIGPAWIDGYVLDFNYYSSSRQAGAANLTWVAPGMAATPGALFEIDDYTRDALDRKEGHPHNYLRVEKIVHTKDGQSHLAYTYIHESEKSKFHAPTDDYVELIRNGLTRLELPTTWLDSCLGLMQRPRFDYVFVYGTLMKGMIREREMKDGSILYCQGSAKGLLYDLVDYPGMTHGKGDVHGEVYKASDMFEFIQRLDWIESCEGNDPLFERTIQEIHTENGKVWAYVYHYARDFDSFTIIESGNWKSKFN
tara:strand:- start:2121 stop:2993 length:873 start_codon:yes stop_codon:yes gene_type:complete